MKKFGKLALVLLVASSVVVVAGCRDASNSSSYSDSQIQEESVLYKSTGGDMISGKRVTGDSWSIYGSDYLDVTITIRDPNNSNTTIASASRGIKISGSSLASVNINYEIDLESGIISGNTIEYTISGKYGTPQKTYPSKTITFTKQ